MQRNTGAWTFLIEGMMRLSNKFWLKLGQCKALLFDAR